MNGVRKGDVIENARKEAQLLVNAGAHEKAIRLLLIAQSVAGEHAGLMNDRIGKLKTGGTAISYAERRNRCCKRLEVGEPAERRLRRIVR